MGRPKQKFSATDELELARAWDQLPAGWVAQNPVEQQELLTEYRDHLGMGNLAKTPQFIPPDSYLKELGMDPRSVRTPVEVDSAKSGAPSRRRITDVKAERDAQLKGLYESSVPSWIREKKQSINQRGASTNSPAMRVAYALGAKAINKLESKYTGTQEYQQKAEDIRTKADLEMNQIREDRIKDPSNKRIIELLEEIESNTASGGVGGRYGEDEPTAETERATKKKGFGLGLPGKALGAAVIANMANDPFGARLIGASSIMMKMLGNASSSASRMFSTIDRNTTSTNKVDTTKMSFAERFTKIWEGDPKKETIGTGEKKEKTGLFERLFSFLKGGFIGLFSKLKAFITPLVGLFSKLATILGPVVALFAAFKAGQWVGEQINKLVTNEDGSNKIADAALKLTGKGDFDPNKYDPVADMAYFRKAEAAGEKISPELAARIEKISNGAVKVKPEMIRSNVTPTPSEGSKIAQQSAAVVSAEAKRDEIAKKNEEQKHKELVNAPKNVQVIAPQTNNNNSNPQISLDTRNPDSTLQLFLQSRMRYA